MTVSLSYVKCKSLVKGGGWCTGVSAFQYNRSLTTTTLAYGHTVAVGNSVTQDTHISHRLRCDILSAPQVRVTATSSSMRSAPLQIPGP
jgi:hypothetical protein